LARKNASLMWEVEGYKNEMVTLKERFANVFQDKDLQVTAAYLWYLGRCPDPEGYEGWMNDPNFTLENFMATAEEECKLKEKCPDPPFIMECPEGYQLVDNMCISDPCAYSVTSNIDCGSYQFDSASRLCIKTNLFRMIPHTIPWWVDMKRL